ncbi:YrhK family protein [Aquibacillus rhizosphaerae]|uniref:YrhK family protein n=1 Tax=Aquibacillus rhizosphaerae TaxID=3051431 RepID=A0ABT7L8G5_9BACI|nr:YrhK family protein [Aquibacillus sp. LR5S19]MDL4842175.1 YrhK family protein [Aquibacillus sp. LR5S19]
MDSKRYRDYLEIRFGKYDLFFKKPYQILYNINDFLISLWFLIGSIFFFYESWKTIGIWFFVIGSAQLSVRPMIRIIHSIHLNKYIKQHFEDRSDKDSK